MGVLVGGLVDGRPSRQLWVFDPVTQQVHCPVVDQLDGETIMQVRVLSSMREARESPTLVSCQGKLYAMGGRDDFGTFASVEVYDPTTNQWTAGNPMVHTYSLTYTFQCCFPEAATECRSRSCAWEPNLHYGR